MTSNRTADHPIDPIYLERWSPRAFTDEAIPSSELQRMFEAARWAPSSSNLQPWRFLYALRGDAHWATFVSLLAESNARWAQKASALVILVSKRMMTVAGKEVPVESYTHSLDAGAAWGYLALEAARMGWAAHGMAGFDTVRAATGLRVPADYRVEVAIAIGRRGDKTSLPEPLAARETPNSRNPQSQFVFAGVFPSAG